MNKIFKSSASVFAAVALHLPALTAPIVYQNHPVPVSQFFRITMTDWCGQSFQQTNSTISGAGIYLMASEGNRTDPATLTISIYDGYSRSGLSGLIASGTTAMAGNFFGFVDVFWTPVAVSAGTQYYMCWRR